MFRINKLTDYAVVLLVHMARTRRVRSAQRTAADTGVPLPTVAKVMKILAKDGLVTATRGVNGGYGLGREPAAITMAHVIQAVEGPIALTACVNASDEACGIESVCPLYGHWNRVNGAVHDALSSVTLDDMTAGLPSVPYAPPAE